MKTDSCLYAIAVTKNHALIYEHYFNKKSATELFNDQSLTKGIMSILMGIAIDKGFVSSQQQRCLSLTIRDHNKSLRFVHTGMCKQISFQTHENRKG